MLQAGAQQGLERGRAHARLDGAEGLDHIDPEAGGVVVPLVQRDPGYPTPTVGSLPLGQQGRLAEPGRRLHQAEPAL